MSRSLLQVIFKCAAPFCGVFFIWDLFYSRNHHLKFFHPERPQKAHGGPIFFLDPPPDIPFERLLVTGLLVFLLLLVELTPRKEKAPISFSVPYPDYKQPWVATSLSGISQSQRMYPYLGHSNVSQSSSYFTPKSWDTPHLSLVFQMDRSHLQSLSKWSSLAPPTVILFSSWSRT